MTEAASSAVCGLAFGQRLSKGGAAKEPQIADIWKVTCELFMVYTTHITISTIPTVWFLIIFDLMKPMEKKKTVFPIHHV